MDFIFIQNHSKHTLVKVLSIDKYVVGSFSISSNGCFNHQINKIR